MSCMSPLRPATVPPRCHLPTLLQCHPAATCQACYSATQMPPANAATMPPRCQLQACYSATQMPPANATTVPPRCQLPGLLQCQPDATYLPMQLKTDHPSSSWDTSDTCVTFCFSAPNFSNEPQLVALNNSPISPLPRTQCPETRRVCPLWH